jgi:hypothetical protein
MKQREYKNKNYEKKNREQVIVNRIKDKLFELENEIREEAFIKIKIIAELRDKISTDKIFSEELETKK